MRYNPSINCGAYTRLTLEDRLRQLEASTAKRAPLRDQEAARIRAYLAGDPAPERPARRRPESYAELKARTYPSQMARPDAPHVPARVGPNTRGGSAASLSYGFTK